MATVPLEYERKYTAVCALYDTKLFSPLAEVSRTIQCLRGRAFQTQKQRAPMHYLFSQRVRRRGSRVLLYAVSCHASKGVLGKGIQSNLSPCLLVLITSLPVSSSNLIVAGSTLPTFTCRRIDRPSLRRPRGRGDIRGMETRDETDDGKEQRASRELEQQTASCI